MVKSNWLPAMLKLPSTVLLFPRRKSSTVTSLAVAPVPVDQGEDIAAFQASERGDMDVDVAVGHRKRCCAGDA